MTDEPDFDELVGNDVAGDERERLRRVHDLLVIAGPPAELTPEVEAGPTLAMTLGGRGRRRVTRRAALLAAAVVVILLAFLGGYIAGNGGGGGLSSGHVLELEGTSQAPGALASLRILPVDPSGNWPMKLSATGLPKLPERGYYEVSVVRNGKIFAPCGWFKVKGPESGVLVWLNAPYELRPGDTWVVTRQIAGEHRPGPVVLRPVNA
jgi:hypothetical protein